MGRTPASVKTETVALRDAAAKLARQRLSVLELAADLTNARIAKANLFRADLTATSASHANFAGADLREARLVDAVLDGATLTDAKLWGTLRDGWSIKGVICERAYWDREGKVATEYAPGEFERVFAEKPRIVLKYADGLRPIDLVMLPLVIERLQAEHPGCKLHLRSIQDEGGGATITITVDDTADRPLEAFRAEVEQLRLDAISWQQRSLKAEGAVAAFTDHIMPLFRELVMSPKYKIIGPAGNVGDGIKAGDVTATNNDLEAIGRLITQVQDNTVAIVARAGKEQLDNLQLMLEQLRTQAASQKPDRALVTEAKNTIRNIVEGSIGSVLGSGWLTALQGLF